MTAFCNWLDDITIASLYPGSPFPRRFLALTLFQSIVQVFRQPLFAYSPIGFHDLNSERNVIAIIDATADSYPEIRSSAITVLGGLDLLEYNPDLFQQTHLVPPPSELLSRGLRLVQSPGEGEGESGAALCRLLFETMVCRAKYSFDVEIRPSSDSAFSYTVRTQSSANVATPIVSFLYSLLNVCRAIIADVKERPVHAARFNPPNGVLSTIDAILSIIPTSVYKVSGSATMLADVFTSLLDLCVEIVTGFMGIMGGDNASSTPSFAQMHESVVDVIKSGTEDADDLTTSFDYVQSMAWISIKNACACLASIATVFTSQESSLSNSDKKLDAEKVGKAMLFVLDKCRHRGILESTYESFKVFSRCMFGSQSVSLKTLPLVWLDQRINELRVSDATNVSVSRRGAGLPFINEAILDAANKQV